MSRRGFHLRMWACILAMAALSVWHVLRGYTLEAIMGATCAVLFAWISVQLALDGV